MSLALMPLFPLIGFLLLILFGRHFREPLGGWIASLMVGAAFAVALGHFVSLEEGNVHQVLWEWLPDLSYSGNLTIGFYLDRMSSLLTLVITGIGFLIHIFSMFYMHGEEKYSRYFAFLNFFVALMLVLVLADSYPLMFVGWEGVGMASYLLIGFWHQDRNNANAARKAFIMNRIGDLGFMLGMFLIFKQFGTLVIPDLMYVNLRGVDHAVIELICFFLLVGAVGKSAQLPLTTWLPDAMAGPTPVSALIHAATMVTAGVYLISRTHFFYDLAPYMSTIVAWVGALTALYGALSALNQHDIKKVLAFSTVSQLGYMFLAVGLGAYWVAIFHLITHAFFKALLFLSSGSVIHALDGEQDIRNMGGLRKTLPFTHAVSLIGVLAIAGIPPLAGFFSKDAILLEAFHQNSVLWAIGMLVAGLTAFYMARWYGMVFAGKYRGTAHPHEGGMLARFPLGVLAAGTVFTGALGLPHFLGHNWLEHFLEETFHRPLAETPLNLELALMAGAVIFAGLGLLWARALYRDNRLDLNKTGFLGKASENALYLNNLYDAVVGAPSRWLAGVLNGADQGVNDTLQETAQTLGTPAGWMNVLQSGYVRAYAATMLIGALAVLGYWAWRVIGGQG